MKRRLLKLERDRKLDLLKPEPEPTEGDVRTYLSVKNRKFTRCFALTLAYKTRERS